MLLVKMAGLVVVIVVVASGVEGRGGGLRRRERFLVGGLDGLPLDLLEEMSLTSDEVRMTNWVRGKEKKKSAQDVETTKKERFEATHIPNRACLPLVELEVREESMWMAEIAIPKRPWRIHTC